MDPRTGALSAWNVRTHLLCVVRGMTDMVCALKGGFQDVEESIIGRTYGPKTGISDRLGIAREGLCDDGDVVSTLLLDLHRCCQTHHTYSDRGCTCRGRSPFEIRMCSPAPITTTLFGALGEAISDLRR